MQIKVVSYNIHRAIGIDRRYQPQRIIKILKDIDADVVLLQEVDSGVPRSQYMDMASSLAKACDYPYHVLGLNVALTRGYYGNATLSRFPIIDNHNIDLTIDNKKSRGCVYTQLKLTRNLTIDLFNLHLGLSAKERRKQCGILLKDPRYKNITETQPCIIAGDFNDWRSLLRILFIEGKEFYCATDHHTSKGESAIKTYPSFSPRGGLDRIYYRGNITMLETKKYQKQVAKIASDHLPIYSIFTLMA